MVLSAVIKRVDCISVNNNVAIVENLPYFSGYKTGVSSL